MIIAGVIGSVITLLITAIIDYYKERYKSSIEMRKMVFQRQTDAAEKAMSWFQESIDCFRMLQMACNEITEKYNPITVGKIMGAVKQADKLYKELLPFENGYKNDDIIRLVVNILNDLLSEFLLEPIDYKNGKIKIRLLIDKIGHTKEYEFKHPEDVFHDLFNIFNYLYKLF